jgi:hypothetical protein
VGRAIFCGLEKNIEAGMALCTDKSLTYLNGIGYNVVRLPRRGIEPLDVLGQTGLSLERLGRLDQIWASSKPVPRPGPDQDAAKISGQRTNEMKLSVGLKLLEGVLAAVGAKVPQVDFAYAKASTLQFTFGDVTARGVDPLLVGEFLGSGDLKGPNPVFDRYFHDEDAKAFVLTEVLLAKSISVSAKDEHSGDVKVDIPAIQQAVGVDVQVAAKVGSGSDLTFAGAQPVTFGFKAFEIAFDGRWRMVGAAAGPDLAFAAGTSPVILRRGGTVNVASAA